MVFSRGFVHPHLHSASFTCGRHHAFSVWGRPGFWMGNVHWLGTLCAKFVFFPRGRQPTGQIAGAAGAAGCLWEMELASGPPGNVRPRLLLHPKTPLKHYSLGPLRLASALTPLPSSLLSVSVNVPRRQAIIQRQCKILLKYSIHRFKPCFVGLLSHQILDCSVVLAVSALSVGVRVAASSTCS